MNPRARLDELRARQARRQQELSARKDQLGARKEQLGARKEQLEARKEQLASRKEGLASKKDELRARQDDLKERQQAMRAQLEERRKARPDKTKEPDRRWRYVVLALLALLLMWLVRDCRCTEPVAPVVVEPEVPAPPAPVEPAPKPDPEPGGRVERKDRPEYFTPPPQAVPWLTSFRLQVAARSPRLSECFVGASRPGTFKWTSTVDPVEGRVTDHVLEPMLDSDELTRQQRNCVVQVLSDPPYGIDATQAETPTKISLVVEF